MKKTYTKKQIQEAIAYWQKQLAKGNYRKVNESSDENETSADKAIRALDAAGFYAEYIDDNTIQLSFDDKYDYYSHVDKIANALYSVDLTEYYIDRPEDEDDPNANWVCPVRFET